MARPPTEPTAAVTAPDLPDGFVLGTATSAYQIEGAVTADGRGRSIWDALALRPGAIAGSPDGMPACDSYNRPEEDVALLAELGADEYRFSIAWPRIQPTGRGKPLQAGLDHYDRFVDLVLEAGIRPNVTLYHWDLPAALEEDLGGWRHRDTAGRFADYATIIGELLGDRVARWSTLNEPWCSAFLGYERGIHAPGVRSEAGAVHAAHNLLLGHGLGVQALRAVGCDQIGIALNLSDVRPLTDDPADIDAAARIDGTQNRWWLGALAGAFPDDVVEHSVAPFVELEELSRDGDAAITAEPLDWLGVNYDDPTLARAGDDPALRPSGPGLDGTESVPPRADEVSTMLGRPIDATGLTAVLHQAHDHLPGLPITVTESGIALPDEVGPEGQVHDPARVAFLTDHLAAALQARADGVPVEGYLAWSLMDDFEWAEGYGPRFGIVHVDHETQVRTPKDSYRWLQELIGSR